MGSRDRGGDLGHGDGERGGRCLRSSQRIEIDGLSLALLTNNARSAALAALDRFNLLDYLDLVLARDDVSSMKPSPAGLQLAQRCLGADKPMAMVGDASIDGVAANRAQRAIYRIPTKH